MSGIDVDELISVHYRQLSPTCMYCKRRPKALRVTVLKKGGVMVAALCTYHASGEMAATTGGLRNPEGTSDFFVE